MATPENVNPRYLLSIRDDPNKVLEPIWGYAREPLVSLTEACKPLHNIVSRLEPHIWVALENSKNPPDNLTQDESAAIHLYTLEWEGLDNEPEGCLYTHLNRTLQTANRSKLRPWFRYLKLFLTALAKLPVSHCHIVWRGIRKDCSADYVPGTEVTWWPFSSCTTALSVLESDTYLGNSGTRTLFSIETLNGRTVRDHSQYKTEDEILLLPGTYLEVLSRLNPAPDLCIIHLRQIRPPHELLEPPYQGKVRRILYFVQNQSDQFIDKNSASLLPEITDFDMTMGTDKSEQFYSRSWYQKKRTWIACIIVAILILLAIILGAVLGTRSARNASSTDTTTTIPTTTTSPFVFDPTANSTITWSLVTWNVRNELNTQVGSNNWTSTNVWIDPNLRNQGLNMKLTHDTAGNWWCAQVKSQTNFAFGNLTFYVNASIDQFDPNVVLRLYTKGSDDQINGIIIEIGSRGRKDSASNDLWYTVYPNAANESTMYSSSRIQPLGGTYTTHRINWMRNIVSFQAEHDLNPQYNALMQFYSYSTNTSWATSVPQIPAPVYMSLCTYNGSAPANGQEVQVNIRGFFSNPI